jgi:hypothetical protein
MTNVTKGTVISGGLIVAFVLALMIGGPYYRVWEQNMAGKARLAEAEYSKQIMLVEAEMNLESEILNAKAEVERARGAAEAMEIVQEKLTDMYIRYLWVRQVNYSDSTVVYIPTEANLPILEATR